MTTTPQTNVTLAQIAAVLRGHESFAICGHVGPDADCVGSQLALKHALEAIGKTVTCLLVKDEALPIDISFLPGADEFIPAAAFEETPQVFIGVDVPTRERIGAAACAVLDRCETSVTIDHHEHDTTMCDFVYVDPDSASASMIVWEIVKLLCDKPSAESALCVYTGLLGDTGGFRFQNSDAAAFSCAAELVEYGVDVAYVATMSFQNRTLASLQLESIAIGRMQVFAEGQAVLSYITGEDFQSAGASKADAEPMIGVIRKLAGVRVACMLREQDGVVRGSLRAKDDTDVGALAGELGGGGHKAAAGFTLELPIAEAVELMREKMCALVQ